MRVIATDKGYFGRIREVDEEFDVPKDLKATWFTPVSAVKDSADKDAADKYPADKKLNPKKGADIDDAPDLS